MTTIRCRATSAALAALLVLPSAGHSQSLLERGPNVAGPWLAAPGVLQFNFVHRFVRGPAPERKITSFPTFLLAAGLPASAMAGLQYSTNSTLAGRYPNEWEFFGRVTPLRAAGGAPVDAGVTIAWNLAAQGPGAEAAVARDIGPARVIALARLLADPDDTGADAAVGGALVLRLARHVAVAADIAALTDRDDDERVAWSAGLQLAIPSSPHTLSLAASNTGGTTMQSASRGGSGTRYGFEFTIPITLSRYLGARAPAGEVEARTDSVVTVRIANLRYGIPLLEVEEGTVVEWVNDDPLVHTVTALDGSFDSGEIRPGQRWRHRFTTRGRAAYRCTPHPTMRGEVRVRPPS